MPPARPASDARAWGHAAATTLLLLALAVPSARAQDLDCPPPEPRTPNRSLDEWEAEMRARLAPDQPVAERLATVRALPAEGPRAVPALMHALRYPLLREAAANALAGMKLPRSAHRWAELKRGWPTGRDLPVLIELVTNRRADVGARAIALFDLQRLGPAAAPAVPVLTDALDDRTMADLAALALGAIGAAAESAVPSLVRLVRRDPNAARAGLRALRDIGTERSQQALLDLLADPHLEPELRAFTAPLLLWCGLPQERVVRALGRVVRTKSSTVVVDAAIEALLTAGPDDDAWPVLFELVADETVAPARRARMLSLMRAASGSTEMARVAGRIALATDSQVVRIEALLTLSGYSRVLTDNELTPVDVRNALRERVRDRIEAIGDIRAPGPTDAVELRAALAVIEHLITQPVALTELVAPLLDTPGLLAHSGVRAAVRDLIARKGDPTLVTPTLRTEIFDPAIPVEERVRALRDIVGSSEDISRTLLAIAEDAHAPDELWQAALGVAPGRIPVSTLVDVELGMLNAGTGSDTASRLHRLIWAALDVDLPTPWRRDLERFFTEVAERDPAEAIRFYDGVLAWADDAHDETYVTELRAALDRRGYSHLPGSAATEAWFLARLPEASAAEVISCIRRLGDVAHPGPATVRVITGFLDSDHHHSVRAAAADALGHIGPPAAMSARDALVRALASDETTLQYAALVALSRIGASPDARDRCADLLQTGRLQVRMRAAEVLARIGGDAIDDLARIAATGSDGAARMLAADALGRALARLLTDVTRRAR